MPEGEVDRVVGDGGETSSEEVGEEMRVIFLTHRQSLIGFLRPIASIGY